MDVTKDFTNTIPEGIPKVIGLTDETANAYKGKT